MTESITIPILISASYPAIDLASTQECSEFGAVWLNSTSIPNMGQINFCNGSQWGTICADDWDHFDAAVVCRELGYTADGKSGSNNIIINLHFALYM